MKMLRVGCVEFSLAVFLLMLSDAYANDLNIRAIRLLATTGQVRLNLPLAITGDNRIAIAGHKVGVTFHVENSVESDRGWLAGVRGDVTIDGALLPELTAGAVGGVDETESEATDTAVSDWVNMVGVAILKALADVQGHDDVLKDRIAFGGFTGIRGQPPSSWPQRANDVQVLILRAVEPYLQGRERIGLRFWLAIEGGVLKNGEIRIDGDVSEEALRSVGQVAFPNGNYALIQYYVLEPIATRH